jgi:hypothetical protein
MVSVTNAFIQIAPMSLGAGQWGAENCVGGRGGTSWKEEKFGLSNVCVISVSVRSTCTNFCITVFCRLKSLILSLFDCDYCALK